MKKALLLVVVALMFIPVAAFAANPTETAAGTIITAEGTQNVLRYSDSGGASKDSIFTATIETTVVAMYGFDPLADLANLTKTTPGVGVTYAYFITNEGNAAFDGTNKLTVNMKATAILSTLTDWSLYITQEGIGGVLSSDTNTPITLSDLAEDASRWIWVTVVPSSTQSLAVNGCYVVMTLEANTTATPAGVYYGANGFTYGGTFESTDLTVTSIETSVMTITRRATVDAPTAGGKFSGDPHAAVPGAVITYTITVSNEGGGQALSVEVVDKVPTRETTAAHISATSTQIGSNVSITADNALDTGWTAYYSKASSPNLTTYGYIGTDWVTVDGSAMIAGKSLTLEAGVTYVKFERLTYPAASTSTLTWGVTIR